MDMAGEVYEYFGTPKGSIDLMISPAAGYRARGDSILRKNGAQIATQNLAVNNFNKRD